ncbi:MAG: hypothetical protein JOS17DRAFT_339436 [Linnemannia elongata]|nr:MAG: hypothetical protein JOS17DRAFT_339436 [Linnemannia elongata]
MNEHQGRDLPLPGPGAGSLGHMGEEKQPHIPGINAARPPTPVGAMPQMMSGDRPLHAATPSAPAHVRLSQGPPRSPAPDARPYGRHGSPAMAPPGSGHGHDPNYPPQHVYGPPPPRGMPQAGPPQGYERQEEEARMRQDHLQVYQHQRQRSGEYMRPNNMEEGQHAPHHQRRHPSDPHAPTPPRDERRPVPPPGTGYPQQGPQHPEERWAQHGRNPSDDRSREIMQQQQQQQHANASRSQGFPPGYPANAPGYGPPKDRNPPHMQQQRSSNNSPVPGSHPDYQRRDTREQGMAYEGQVPNRQGSGMEHESRRPAPQDSRMTDVRPTEQQDQDDIAASLVSLSGKGHGGGDANGNSRQRAHAEDDDYDMEEPDSASVGNTRPPVTQDIKERSSAPGPYSQRDSGREQSPTPQPASFTQQQRQGQGRPEERSEPQHRGPNDGDDRGGPITATRVQSMDSPALFDRQERPSTKSRTEGEDASSARKVDDEAMSLVEQPTSMKDQTQQQQHPSSGQQAMDEKERSAAHQSNNSDNAQPDSPVTPPTSGSLAASAAAKPASAAAAPAQDDDTEMEEGEVREDEDEEVDEVLSSGAVPTVGVAGKDSASSSKE